MMLVSFDPLAIEPHDGQESEDEGQCAANGDSDDFPVRQGESFHASWKERIEAEVSNWLSFWRRPSYYMYMYYFAWRLHDTN